MFDFALSIVVLAAILLVGGAIFLFRRGRITQGWLMIALALVMAANVAVWLVPYGDSDDTPAERAAAFQ